MSDGGTTAVWFDLDGTLVRLAEPYGDVLAGVFEAHLGTTAADLVAAYDEAFYGAFEALDPDPVRRGMAAVIESAAASAEMADGSAEAVDDPDDPDDADDPDAAGGSDAEDDSNAATAATADPAAMAETLREREYAATAVSDAARRCVDRLAADGRVGVLTNGWREWQVGKLEHHGLADRFDAVVTSYEAGAHKPDAAPFELARERLEADRHVMVGDDDADVEGARAAGFHPVRYEDGGEGGPDFWETLDVLLRG